MSDSGKSEIFPCKPREPEPGDCCGSGCSYCVHDIYENDLKIWKQTCKEIKEKGFHANIVNRNVALSPDRYTEFELVDRQPHSKDSYIFTLKVPQNTLLGLSVGQHVIVRQSVGTMHITRQYTPISGINDEESFRILIKIYPNGKITPLINTWKIGELIPIRGPFGNFNYKPNAYKRLLMVAAGTGICPMYPLIKTVIENEADFTVVRLLYCSRSFDDILLRDELLQMQSYWNFKMVHFLSKEVSLIDKKYCEVAHLRRMKKVDVENEIKSAERDLLVVVCGTNSFEKDVVNACLNVDASNIHRF